MGITATPTSQHQVARYEISSLTTPQKRGYVVSLYDDGSWKCSCPAWVFKKGAQRHDCKHIDAVRDRRDNFRAEPVKATIPAARPQAPVVPSAPATSNKTGMEAFDAGKNAAKPGYTGRKVIDYDFDMVIEERDVVLA